MISINFQNRCAAWLNTHGMLFKETTQWLRGGRVAETVLGVLAVGWLIIVFTGRLVEHGRPAAYILWGLLGMLGLFQIMRLSGSTRREVEDRTLELHYMTGITGQDMARARMLIYIHAYLFWAACLVPFAFLTYFMGEVSFLEILGVPLAILLLSLPFHLLVQILSSYPKTSLLGRIIRIPIICILLMQIMPMCGGIFFAIHHYLKDLVGSVVATGITAILMGAFYIGCIALLLKACAGRFRIGTAVPLFRPVVPPPVPAAAKQVNS